MLRRIKPFWVLTGAGLLLAVVTVLYVSMDQGICPPTDSEHHTLNAQLFARTIHLFGISGLWELMRASYPGWPPGSYVLLYGPLAWLMGEGNQMVRLCALPLIPLLLWGVFRLNSALLGDRLSGTLAAALTIFSFGIAGQLRQVSIDLPATAAVLLAALALLRAQTWTRLRPSLLFGATCGLCLFCRVQAIFFLSGPALLTAFFAWQRCSDHGARARLVGRMALALLTAAAISSPWWFGHLRWLWDIMTSHLTPERIQPRGDPGFLPGLTFYAAALGRICGWPTLLSVIVTLPLLLKKSDPTHPRVEVLALVALVLGGLLGGALGIHREARYLLPAIPAMAVLAALGLRRLSRPWQGLLAAGLLLLTVGPTLLLSGFGLRGNSKLARHGVVEWGYSRIPVKVPSWEAAQEVARVLYRASGKNRQGDEIYLLLVQEEHMNYLPRITSFLAPQFPDLLFSYTNNLAITNSGRHLMERNQRWLFLLTETRHAFDLPLLWAAKKHRYKNPVPIRLYRVPPPHGLYRAVHRHNLKKYAVPTPPDSRPTSEAHSRDG